MNNEELCEISMSIIISSGNAKSLFLEAIKNARNKEFDKSKKNMDLAKEELLKAHEIQTKLISEDISDGSKINMNLLLIHAQDHIMNTMLLKDLTNEIVEIHKKLGGEKL